MYIVATVRYESQGPSRLTVNGAQVVEAYSTIGRTNVL